MSYPKYSGDITNASFNDLAKYANHAREQDVNLNDIANDLQSFGYTGTAAGKGVLFSRGFEKVDNVINKKGRCNMVMYVTAPLGFNTEGLSGYIYENGGVLAASGPIAEHIVRYDLGVPVYGFTDLTNTDEQKYHLLPLTTFDVEEVRFWLWAEEDDNEYPSSSFPSPKTDRLMFRELVGGTELGDAFNQDFTLTGLTNTYQLKLSGLGNTFMNQANVYGVPEGIALSRFKLTDSVAGSGSYYLWVGIGYEIKTTGGFSVNRTEASGTWYGPYFKGGGSTATVIQQTFPLSGDLRTSLPTGSFMSGLEDDFDPSDNIISGSQHFADYEISTYLTAYSYTPNSGHPGGDADESPSDPYVDLI